MRPTGILVGLMLFYLACNAIAAVDCIAGKEVLEIVFKNENARSTKASDVLQITESEDRDGLSLRLFSDRQSQFRFRFLCQAA